MGKENVVHARLAKLQKSWSKTEARRPDAQLEDGDYAAELTELRVDVSKSDRLQVVSKWKAVEGPNKGGSVTRYDGIDDETGMSFFKGYAAILGIEVPEDLADLPDALEEFLKNNDDTFNITVKTKEGSDFKNTYVKGPVMDGSELDGSDTSGEADEPKKKTGKGKAKAAELEEDVIELEEGKKYKITLKSGKSVTGTVVELEEDTITVDDENDESYSIKRSRIESAELVRKKK